MLDGEYSFHQAGKEKKDIRSGRECCLNFGMQSTRRHISLDVPLGY